MFYLFLSSDKKKLNCAERIIKWRCSCIWMRCQRCDTICYRKLVGKKCCTLHQVQWWTDFFSCTEGKLVSRLHRCLNLWNILKNINILSCLPKKASIGIFEWPYSVPREAPFNVKQEKFTEKIQRFLRVYSKVLYRLNFTLVLFPSIFRIFFSFCSFFAVVWLWLQPVYGFCKFLSLLISQIFPRKKVYFESKLSQSALGLHLSDICTMIGKTMHQPKSALIFRKMKN